MTTNYEWLLNMGGEERQAWFDAEHNDTLAPENVVTSDDVDANSLTQDDCETDTAESVPQESLSDTREKLEADVNAYIMQNIGSSVTWEVGNTLKLTILALLDRQAAITEREIFDEMPYVRNKFAYQKERIAELEKEIRELCYKNDKLIEIRDELQEQVDELERENRDELQSYLDEIAELVGWHGEVDGNSGESLLVPMVSAMCEGSELASKLAAENAELKEELAVMEWHSGCQRYELAKFNHKGEGYFPIREIKAKDGMPILRGQVLYGGDGKAWKITRFDGKHYWSEEGKRLKPEWLTHEKPDSFGMIVSDLRHRMFCLKGGSYEYNELGSIADRIEKLAKEDAWA